MEWKEHKAGKDPWDKPIFQNCAEEEMPTKETEEHNRKER